MHGKGLWVLCPALRCLSMRTGLPLRCSAEINGSFLLAPEYVCFSAAHATMLLYTLHTLSLSAILPSAHRPTRVSVVLMTAMYSKLWAPKALGCHSSCSTHLCVRMYVFHCYTSGWGVHTASGKGLPQGMG